MAIAFELIWGKTATFDLTVQDDVGLVNLTGKILEFGASLDFGGPLVIHKTTGAGITNLDQATNKGQAVLQLDPVDTASLAEGRVTVLNAELDLDDGTNILSIDTGLVAVLPAVIT